MTGADTEKNGPYAITIVHVFDAPRELVFRNWIAAADLATWFAPDNCTVTFCEVDARPGGKWRVEYHCDFGSDYIEHGEFHEVVEPERLVFSLTQEDRDGRVGHRTLITLSFAHAGAQTEMTFTQTGFETPRRRDNNTEGWNECFAKLTAHIREATMNHDEAEIRALIERWATAVHTGDLDVVLADHTEDIVMFDVPPPNEVRNKTAYLDT